MFIAVEVLFLVPSQQTKQRKYVCVNLAHTHTTNTPVCNLAPHCTAPESSLMPQQHLLSTGAHPSVACDLPPSTEALGPHLPPVCPRARAAGTLLLTRTRGNQLHPQGTVLCAHPGPSRLQTPLMSTRLLTGI